jgi:hypothetical protein
MSAAPFLLSATGSGRASAYLESGKIITFQGRTHVTWLDTPPEGFRIKIRTLDHASGQWSPTVTVGEAVDNHGGPALTVDADGYLHIVYFSHHHPFRYHRSLLPNDASAWGAMEQFGQDLTYPTLLCAKDGTLILTARRSFDDRPWELELWTKSPGATWTRQRALLRSRQLNYNQFAASMMWAPDHRRLYLSFRIYEMPDYEKKDAMTAVGCITSPDAGVTWTKLDGSSLPLPASVDELDNIVVCDSREGRIADNGSMAVSPDGAPWLVYSIKTPAGAECFLATPQPAGGWRQILLNDFLPATHRGWAMVHQGGVVFTPDGQLMVVSTIMDIKSSAEAWAHPSTEIVQLISRDGGIHFSSGLVSETDPQVPHWLPNLEKPTGFNATPAQPGMIYTGGGAGTGLGDVLTNQVWWRRLGSSGTVTSP